MFKFIKGIYKKDHTEANECKNTDNDKELAGAMQVQQNIQDVVDEWWSNDNLTEEQQLIKNKLFPNGKPTADEFLITFVKYARAKPEYKKLQEEIERKKRKRQTIKDVLSVTVVILLLLASAIYFGILEKNEAQKNSKTVTSTSMQAYWW